MIDDYGFAAIPSGDPLDPGLGWELTATGQIRRAAGAAHKIARLLRPLWGPVWSEKHRGNAERLKKFVDAAPVIVADRIRLVLQPMLDSGEIADLNVTTGEVEGGGKFLRANISGVDQRKQVFQLSEFVRIGG